MGGAFALNWCVSRSIFRCVPVFGVYCAVCVLCVAGGVRVVVVCVFVGWCCGECVWFGSCLRCCTCAFGVCCVMRLCDVPFMVCTVV